MVIIVRNNILRPFGACGLTNKLLTPMCSQLRQQKLSLTSSTPAAAARSPVTVEEISDNLSFRPASSAHSASSSAHADASQRPIVLIYAWLAAKSRHIHKFGDFYIAKGFDVLHIKVNARQVLWPPHAHSVVSQILAFLTSRTHHLQPIIIHGFSVGGYLYGETLNHIVSDAELTATMTRRIRGQVFDSPVDFEGVPRGVGMALSGVWPVQVAIRSSLEAYTGLFQRQVTAHYVQSERTFRQNPLRTPSLVLYSKADVVGTPGPIQSLISTWRGHGVPVYSRCWEKTLHVGHYVHDPVTYTAVLNEFLVNIGLVRGADDEEQMWHRRETVAMPASKL